MAKSTEQHEPTAATRKQAETMASLGLTREDIALVLVELLSGIKIRQVELPEFRSNDRRAGIGQHKELVKGLDLYLVARSQREVSQARKITVPVSQLSHAAGDVIKY